MKKFKSIFVVAMSLMSSIIIAMQPNLTPEYPQKALAQLVERSAQMSPQELLASLKALPYSAQAVDVADQLKTKRMRIMFDASVSSWHETARESLTHGSALFESARAGDLQAVKQLLADKTANWNWQNNDQENRSVLGIASVYGWVDIVAMLLRAGANPNVKDILGRSPLWEASYNGYKEIAEELIFAGAQIDDNIIYWTKRRGYERIVAFLEAEKRKQK